MKRKNCNAMKRNETARMIDVVNLCGLVLIRRNGQYYVTDKQFVNT